MKDTMRIWLLTALVALILVASVSAAGLPAEKGLVYLPLPAGVADNWQPEGVEVYARLHGRSGAYLLAGATKEAQATLSRSGISYRLLDSAIAEGETYFWVAPGNGRAAPDWSAYGRVLLYDGYQYLLQTTPQQAEQLGILGAHIAHLFLLPQQVPDTPSVIPPNVDADPIIQAMLPEITTNRVSLYDGSLSGEWPVTIGGQPYTIASRYTYSGTPIQKATQYAGERFAQLGLDVEYHVWGGSTYPNVIATLPGQTHPEQIVIICAHLDSVPSGALAPGADDNASGSTGVLIAAEILSRYQWDVTLRFALWTGEEQGLYGSAAYALRSFNANEQIIGVLNMDMIAYDAIGAPILDLHAKSTLPDSVNLANLFADVVGEYGLALQPQVFINNWLGNYSDNKSFWDRGYTAILVIEDYDDFTPYYHTINDRLNTLNLTYFMNMTRASVATFAHLAGTPWWGTVQGQVTMANGTPVPQAHLLFQSAQHTRSYMTGDNGRYNAPLPAGLYTLTVTVAGYDPVVISGIQVNDDATITQDVVLGELPLGGVQGFVTDVVTQEPIAGAEITLSQGMTTTYSTQTDASGYYTLTLPAGGYDLTATAVGYYPTTLANVQITPGVVLTQNLALEALVYYGVIHGMVSDAITQAPIAGAEIGFWQGMTVTHSVQTDANGAYTATLPVGTYELQATAVGYYPSTLNAIEITYGEPITQDITLEALLYQGTLNGTITDALTAAPIAHATITFWQAITPTAVISSSLSGSYTIALPAGVYTMTVTAVSYHTQTLTVTIPINGIAEQDVALEPIRYPIYLPLISNNPIEQPSTTFPRTQR